MKDEFITDLGMAVIALRCAENIIDLIKQYYEAIEKPKDLIITDAEEFSKEGLEYIRQRVKNYRSDTIVMEKEDYLSDLIQSKIEIITVVGGFNLLKEVYEELILHERHEPDYPLAEIFSILATGIGGWSS